MVLPHGKGDLYHKYRPRRFGEVSGHKEIIKSIKQAVVAEEPAQAFLLTGDSGTGKTTTARIMALALNCEQLSKEGEPCLKCASCLAITTGKCTDLIEVNAADHRGIGDIRALCQSMPMMPLQLKTKVFILDEAHQLTNDAQSSLLKELEEAPSHVFIILCSTHPKKIIPTIKTRCQKFTFSTLSRREMLHLLEEVATLEGQDFPKKVYEAVVDSSGGSPRNGLVKLQQVFQLGSKNLSEILKLLSGEEQKDPNIIKICFELDSGYPKWATLSKLYNECKHMGPGAIGMVIAGYYRNRLLKAKDANTGAHCANILQEFVEPFPEGKLGENLLVLSLHKAFTKLARNSRGA